MTTNATAGPEESRAGRAPRTYLLELIVNQPDRPVRPIDEFHDQMMAKAEAERQQRAAASAAAPTDRAALRDRIVAAIKASPFQELRTTDYANGPLQITVKVDDLADTLLRRLVGEAQSCRWEHPHPGYQCKPRTVVEAHDTGTQQQAARGCPACDAGIAHTVHCPTPESHNWGCGCPGDRLPLYSDRGVDTPGCDCGHTGMGMRWHDGGGCAWFKQLTDEGRRLLAEDDAEPAPVAQQPAAEAGPLYPARHTWTFEVCYDPDGDKWHGCGPSYDSSVFDNAHETAQADFRHRAENDRQRRKFRMVRATTTFTVEAEHTPPAEPRP